MGHRVLLLARREIIVLRYAFVGVPPAALSPRYEADGHKAEERRSYEGRSGCTVLLWLKCAGEYAFLDGGTSRRPTVIVTVVLTCVVMC